MDARLQHLSCARACYQIHLHRSMMWRSHGRYVKQLAFLNGPDRYRKVGINRASRPLVTVPVEAPVLCALIASWNVIFKHDTASDASSSP